MTYFIDDNTKFKELIRELIDTCIKSLPIGEINSSDSAVGMNLHSSGFNVICTIGSSCKIRQIKLNLIPST